MYNFMHIKNISLKYRIYAANKGIKRILLKNSISSLIYFDPVVKYCPPP